jgi:hypothetical protein
MVQETIDAGVPHSNVFFVWGRCFIQALFSRIKRRILDILWEMLSNMPSKEMRLYDET